MRYAGDESTQRGVERLRVLSRALLGGCIAGVLVGLVYCELLKRAGAYPSKGAFNLHGIRRLVFAFMGTGAALAGASTSLGAWFSGVRGPAQWPAAIVGALIAAGTAWILGYLPTGPWPRAVTFCLSMSFVVFFVTAAICTRKRDNLF